MRILIGLIAALIMCLLGCDSDTRVNDLQKQIKELDTKVKTLESDLDNIKNENSAERFDRDIEGIAYLTPGSTGYSVIKIDLGYVTVSLEDIKPYANGSRVALRFGNPTNAILTDMSATLEWGAVDSKGAPLNAEAKSKEIPFVKSFRPGSWNTIDVVLEGIPPTNLGFVRVKDVKNKGIQLFK
jgi:outer membrane murein-binding lipoprotein Lpp